MNLLEVAAFVDMELAVDEQQRSFRAVARELMSKLDATTSAQLDVLRELEAAACRRRRSIERAEGCASAAVLDPRLEE